MLVGGGVGDEFAHVVLRVLSLEAVDSILHLATEVLYETLYRPCSSVTEGADCVTFNLEGELLQHVDLSEISVTLLNASEEVDHPSSTLTARSALTAALVLVELSEAENGIDNISLLVHDDDGCGTETTLDILESVEVHQDLTANFLGKHRDGGTARDDSLKVVPAADHTTAVPVNQLTKRDAHLFLNSDGIVDMTTNTEELGALILVTAEASEPRSTSPHNGRYDRHSLHISNGSGATVETSIGWEWRLQAGAAGLALEAFDQG